MKKDLLREQRIILLANPNKRRQLRNETIDGKRGRRPKQYSDNNGTPSSEGTNLGDMALSKAVSARSIASAASPIASD